MSDINHDPLAINYDPNDKGYEKELPSIGEHQAVCCQIHNLGFQEFKGKVSASPKCVLVFELDEKMQTGDLAGRPFVMSEKFGMFLGPDSKLRKFLQSWRGNPFSDEELKAFTLRKLISAPCTLMIIHEPTQNGGMRAKIVGITKAKAGAPRVPVTYTDTPKWVQEEIAKQVYPKSRQAVAAPQPAMAGALAAEDDLPF